MGILKKKTFQRLILNFRGIKSFFFSNSVESLNFAENAYIKSKLSEGVLDPEDRAIDKIKTHGSVLVIKDKIFQKKSNSIY